MNTLLFFLINFVVAFISDIALNDLSTHYGYLPSLKPYYKNESILKMGLYAAIPISVALIITIFLYYAIFRALLPNNYTQLFYFCIIAFVIGYILDVAIDKLKIFGSSLDQYYKEYGAGFWGAMAYLFSIIVSYFIEKIIYILV
jgi:hypothetical protein